MAAIPSSEAGPSAPSANNASLLAQIFGDSDDSDLSEDEDDKVDKSKTVARRTLRSDSEDNDDEEEEDNSDDSGADQDYGALPSKAGKPYVPDGGDSDEEGQLPKSTSFIPNDQQKQPKKSKKKKEKREDGEDGEGEVKERIKKKKPRVERRLSVEQEVEELDEATKRRRLMEAKVDAVGKKSKRKRPRRQEDSEDLGVDDIISDVQNLMQKAVEKDIEQNDLRKPALYKTELLPKVLATLQNVTYQQAILDTSDFLGALRQFLEPLPDGSLPSLSIQRALLEQLNRMEFSEEMLRESKLGRIVNFYARCKRAIPEINRQANALIDKWSRPMLHHHAPGAAVQDENGGQNGNASDSDLDGDDGEKRVRKKKKQNKYLQQVMKEREEMEKDADAPKTSRIPSIFGNAYSIAPSASRTHRTQEEIQADESRKRQQEKINNFKKKAMKAGTR